MKDLYAKYDRKIGKKILEIDTFFIDGTPVCMSWYGCKDHKREACQFLLQRQFGTILVCGLRGDDIHQIADSITAVPDECPLHRGSTK